MTRGPWIAIVCALGLAGPACGLGDPNDRLMTDDELLATFRSERAAFDSLATMLGEDGKVRFLDHYALYLDRGDTANSYQLPGVSTPGVPGERRDTYERLLRRIRVGRNVWSDSSGILFQQYVRKLGPVEARWMRGYYFARRPLPAWAMVRETDLLKDAPYSLPPSAGMAVYRHLDGPWYLYSMRGYTDD